MAPPGSDAEDDFYPRGDPSELEEELEKSVPSTVSFPAETSTRRPILRFTEWRDVQDTVPNSRSTGFSVGPPADTPETSARLPSRPDFPLRLGVDEDDLVLNSLRENVLPYTLPQLNIRETRELALTDVRMDSQDAPNFGAAKEERGENRAVLGEIGSGIGGFEQREVEGERRGISEFMEPSTSREELMMAEGGAQGGEGERTTGKKPKSRKARPQRSTVVSETELEVVDDGFRWRKYGQKAVKGSPFPRHYYRCTFHGCECTKHVSRSPTHTRQLVTVYKGGHSHARPDPNDLPRGPPRGLLRQGMPEEMLLLDRPPSPEKEKEP